MDREIRVPLAIDAQVKFPFGPALLSLRSLTMAAACLPLVLVIMELGFVSSGIRLILAGFVLMLAIAMAAPMSEGVWFGLYLLYGRAAMFMPSLIRGGEALRGRVRMVGSAVVDSDHRPLFAGRSSYTRLFDYFTSVPRAAEIENGIFRLDPGGYCAIVEVPGPITSMVTDGYTLWCDRMMKWLVGVECPAQVLTVVSHFDSRRAELAFDARMAPDLPASILRDDERILAARIAERSLGLRHYVIFSPSAASPGDGKPYLAKFRSARRIPSTSHADAAQVMGTALRLSRAFQIDAEPLAAAEVARLVEQTVVGAASASVSPDLLQIGDQHHVVMTATKMPPRVFSGQIVEALMHAQSRGVASLHVFPVSMAAARKEINRQNALRDYSARRGGGDIGTALADQDAQQVLAEMAMRDVALCRVALTLSVQHTVRETALDTAERLEGLLQGYGFTVEPMSRPGFLPALAIAPGGAPLGRSVQMTTTSVALRLLPTLGTPFADNTRPLVGINLATGAPAYLSVYDQANYNAVIIGTAGSGKSVAAKTLLSRETMGGVSPIVIDPDSEYRSIIEALGGDYIELGHDAINPLAAGVGLTPDTAAGLILPVLSVLAGDEKGVVNGRPIRRLPDEDLGWLHNELTDFYERYQANGRPQEPVLHELVAFLTKVSYDRALSEQAKERCRIITARLQRYTQGAKASIFDRPTSFTMSERPIGIGLRTIAMSYGADLTPALAIVLTSIMASMESFGRRLIVVDEAHRVTSDPDAGRVLEELVRQARKYETGVWMCSQQVEDFVNTDLGKVLASTAATKLILGVEEPSVPLITEVFNLRPEEVAAITPISKGRGVLISGGARTTVRIFPGPLLLQLSQTTTGFKKTNRSRAA